MNIQGRKFTALIMAVIMLATLAPAAIADDTVIASGNCGGSGSRFEDVSWFLTVSGVLSITAKVPNASMIAVYNVDHPTRPEMENPPPWYPYADQIKEVIIGAGLANVGNFMLYGCQNLKVIRITDANTIPGGTMFGLPRESGKHIPPNGITVYAPSPSNFDTFIAGLREGFGATFIATNKEDITVATETDIVSTPAYSRIRLSTNEFTTTRWIGAYSVGLDKNGTRKWKKWPSKKTKEAQKLAENKLLEKILKKPSELWLSDQTDEKDKAITKNIVVSECWRFPAIEASPKVKVMAWADETDRTVWKISQKTKKDKTSKKFPFLAPESEYEYSLVIKKTPPDWKPVPAEGIPMPTEKTKYQVRSVAKAETVDGVKKYTPLGKVAKITVDPTKLGI